MLLERKKLHRDDIIRLVQERGSAWDLDITYSDMSGSHLGSNIVSMPNLDGIVFGRYGDVLSGSWVVGTHFQRTRLRNAKLVYANCSSARFYLSDLLCSDLRFVNFSNANMVEADMRSTNLFGANLNGADLLKAKLEGADLFRAKFSGRTNLRRTNLGKRLLQEDKTQYRRFVEQKIVPTSLHTTSFHMADRFHKVYS